MIPAWRSIIVTDVPITLASSNTVTLEVEQAASGRGEQERRVEACLS
jgi:hypothetical protein